MSKLRGAAAAIGVAVLLFASTMPAAQARTLAPSQVQAVQSSAVRCETLRFETPRSESMPANGVRIVPGSTINLVASQSRVPVSIRNDYDSDVRVFLWAQPGALWLEMPRATQVIVPANTTINATVPIKAISNGDAEVRVYLTSFSGVKLGRAVWMHLHVERDFEPVMLIGFGTIVAALGFVGARRMLHRRRGQSQVSGP